MVIKVKDFKLLRVLDKFEGFFTRIDVDYNSMRKILQVKLTLDSRRTPTISNEAGKNEKKEKNLFFSSLFSYIFIGLFLVPLLFIGESYLVSMGLLLGVFMFLMMTSLISDFSNVLLDVRDKELILTKPVNSRTLNLAKILHIFNYVFIMTMAITLPSLLVGIFKIGPVFALIYILSLVLIDLFIIALTALIYLLILRFFSGDKLRDIINYIQIGMTLLITLGFQILVRVFDLSEILNFQINPSWWSFFLPPLWFSALFELILNGAREVYVLVYSLMGLVIPILAILLYIKLIPVFESNLQKLIQADNRSKDKNKLRNFLAKTLTNNREERAFFRFTTSMIKNDRSLKLKLYPNLGFALIFPLLMIISGGIEDIGELEGSYAYLFIYMIGLSIPGIIKLLAYSENHRASLLYRQFPIKLENLYKGSLKAVFVNLISPVLIILSLVFYLIFKGQVIIHLIIAYLGILLSMWIIFKISKKTLPFSKDFNMIGDRGGLGTVFLTMLIYGSLAVLDFGFSLINYGEYIYLVLLIIANIYVWEHGFKDINIKGIKI